MIYYDIINNHIYETNKTFKYIKIKHRTNDINHSSGMASYAIIAIWISFSSAS